MSERDVGSGGGLDRSCDRDFRKMVKAVVGDTLSIEVGQTVSGRPRRRLSAQLRQRGCFWDTCDGGPRSGVYLRIGAPSHDAGGGCGSIDPVSQNVRSVGSREIEVP